MNISLNWLKKYTFHTLIKKLSRGELSYLVDHQFNSHQLLKTGKTSRQHLQYKLSPFCYQETMLYSFTPCHAELVSASRQPIIYYFQVQKGKK